MVVNLRQTHFRFGVNELAESTHGWYAAEDVNPTQGAIPVDTTFLLRFTEQETGGTAAGNTDAQFQRQLNGGGWVNITTTSSVVKAVTTTVFANAAACTKRLSGTGTFESSGQGCTHDGLSGGAANDIAASGNSETECALQIVSTDVVSGDVIEFRFTSPDWTVTHDITPSYTVLEGSAVTLAGTSGGVATAAGATLVKRGIAGTATGVSTAVAALTVTSGMTTIAGTANGAATVTAAVSVRRGLAGSSAGAATVSGSAVIALVLAATPAGVATVVGALAVLTTTWQDYGSIILLDVSKYGGTVTFYFEATHRVTAGGTARARLYDVTGGAEVANSTVSTTSTTLVRQRSGALTLTGSKEYKAQQGVLSGATSTIRGARLVVEQA